MKRVFIMKFLGFIKGFEGKERGLKEYVWFLKGFMAEYKGLTWISSREGV